MEPHGRALVWVCLAGATIIVAASGCGRRLRGIDSADQTVLHGRRSVLQQADGVEAVVSPVRVPWGSKSSPVGFFIELTNLTEGPIRLAVEEIELHDAFGRIYQPVAPERLLRSFGAGAGKEARVRTVAYRPRVVRRYYYRRYPVYRRHWLWPYRYGYCYGPSSRWYGGLYYDSGYDPYLEQQRTARFLSELLTDQVVEPKHTVVGHVVFSYRLGNDEELTLLLRVHHERAPGASQPARLPETVEPAALRTTTLSFRFDVD